MTSKLKIISAYSGTTGYLRAARSKPQSEWGALWHAQAVAPYWSEWALGQIFEERTRQLLRPPITNLDGLQAEVDCLSASGIEALVEDAYDRITALLPSPLTERAVCIYPADPDNAWLFDNGAVGNCIGDNILLQVNPLSPVWRQIVPFVLAHEYHHTVWGYNYFAVLGKTHMDLLTGLLTDGQADSFARLLCPDLLPSWLQALTPAQEVEQWGKIQPFLSGNDEDIYRRFFFGDEPTGTPLNTAYTIGYHIVQAYLNSHPARTLLDLMNLDAQTILSESGYLQVSRT